MSFSIIIPSRNLDNLTKCVRVLRAMGEDSRILCVADGVAWTCFPNDLGVWTISGARPFVFARNANIGIRVVRNDDVILLNDDIILETYRGLSMLAPDSTCDIISPRVYGPAELVHAATQLRVPPEQAPTTTIVPWVPFACVYIRRKLIDAIGLLDEQFVPGGWEDRDYCRRAQEYWKPQGWRNGIGVNNHVFVDHHTLPHTFRPEGKPDLYDFAANKNRFEEKWRGK